MNNRRIRKLTPATLKRLIAEEKFKIKSEMSNRRNSSKVSNKDLVEAYLKCLNMLKEAKTKKRTDLKKIQTARRLIKSRLMKRL